MKPQTSLEPIESSEEFQRSKALNLKPDLQLESNFVYQRSNSGFPIYTSFYNHFEGHLLQKIACFNSKLRERFPLNHTKAGALLDLSLPVIKYYSSMFPQNQFKVLRGQEVQFMLKPACCAHAFSIWASKKKHLLNKEILHEISDCYRVEKTGTVRSLTRNCFFTMPDYHLLTLEEESEKDFEVIRDLLLQFYEDLFGSTGHFLEVTRFVNPKKLDLSVLKHPHNKDTTYYEVINCEQSKRPYYSKKWQYCYRGGSKLYTLATVQIDPYYPQIFGLNESKRRVGVHFSMGSLPRIIQSMILQNKIPQKGVKIYSQVDVPLMDLVKDLSISCAVLLDNESKSLSEALSVKSPFQKYFFSKVIFVGRKDWPRSQVTVVDRLDKSQVTVPKDELNTTLKDLNIRSQEFYFSRTLK